MRSLRGIRWACALLLAGAGAGQTQAAWNNVFQVCCNSCGHGAAISAYAPSNGCCPQSCCPQSCCPQPVCTTQYVQRCYYQPVTCYQTRSYYEPVTTYRTSYYYEPVTSYRYSCYYDPCSCGYQQVACPQTCYRLRSQCCAVTSYVQRCCRVPVTSYRQCNYWEPVTTCCAPSCCPTSCCDPCCPTSCNGTKPCPPAEAAPTVTEQLQPQAPPAVTEQQIPPIGNGTSNQTYRYLPPTSKPSGIQQGSYRPATPPAQPRYLPAPAPAVKLDRIVAAPANSGVVKGQVVRNDQSPRSGAQLMFVSVQKHGQQTVTADTRGQFHVSLASGSWLVYLNEANGKQVFQKRIEVEGSQVPQLTLVSR